MLTKTNYKFERKERERAKAAKKAEKLAAKAEAKESSRKNFEVSPKPAEGAER